MATPQQVVEKFVEAFVAAWPSRDVATVADFFTDNASYHNGPLAPVHGRVAIKAALADFMAYGGEVRVDIRNLLANDRVVMTERVDHFVLNGTERHLRSRNDHEEGCKNRADLRCQSHDRFGVVAVRERWFGSF